MGRLARFSSVRSAVTACLAEPRGRNRPAAAASRAGKSAFARARSLSRRLPADAEDIYAAACTSVAQPNATDHADRSRRVASLRLPERAGVGALRRPLPSGTTTASDRAAGRHRARPTVGGRPASIHQRAVQVLVAAILHPAIRGARTTRGGTCRASPTSKPADDRRGSGAPAASASKKRWGTNRRRAFRCPTRLPATDAAR